MSVEYKRGLALIFHETWKRKHSVADASALKEALEIINCKVGVYPTVDGYADDNDCGILTKLSSKAREIENINKTMHDKADAVAGRSDEGQYLESTEIKTIMDELESPECRRMLQDEVDYLVIAHFSHGTHNGLVQVGAKGELLALRDIYLDPLMEMEELRGKLIWLIVQACRGKIDNYLTEQYDVEKPKRRLISMACSEGGYCVAVEKGSLYIQTLAKLLTAHAHEWDLLKILDEVTKQVVKESPEIIRLYDEAKLEKAAKKPKTSEAEKVQIPENDLNFSAKFDFRNGFEDADSFN